MKAIATLILCLFSGLILGCNSTLNGPPSEYSEFGDRVNTRGFGHKYAQPEGQEELVLGPGDEIDIQIARNPDISGAQRVRTEGDITAPFVGDVKVAGLTTNQVRDKLTIMLAPFLRDVSVQVVRTRLVSKSVYIFTLNARGGIAARQFPLQGDLTLIDLISRIGGLNELVDDCHVKVITPDPRHPKTLTINVRDMILTGHTAANIRLRPNDMIYMPPTFFARVAQVLAQVTLPLRVISNSLREAADTILFIEDGDLPRSRRGRNF